MSHDVPVLGGKSRRGFTRFFEARRKGRPDPCSLISSPPFCVKFSHYSFWCEQLETLLRMRDCQPASHGLLSALVLFYGRVERVGKSRSSRRGRGDGFGSRCGALLCRRAAAATHAASPPLSGA